MILYTSVFILCEFWRQASAAPVPIQYVTWQNEPNGRGTWSILFSCTTTLILCVYTAIHMNVRYACEPLDSRKWHVMAWVLSGIFAPELVVWTAWCQFSEARRLTKEMRSLRAELDPKADKILSQTAVGDETELVPRDESSNLLQSANDRNIELRKELLDSWTMQHSFFIVMGGYQFHPEAVRKGDTCTELPPIVLHRKCLLALLREGYAKNIPLLSSQELADRSKADSLAKVLSCIQGAWLVFQLLGRVIERLSITELEVNTFAHVICALAMYAFWMSKPLNVQEPVFVASDGLEHWLDVISLPEFCCKAVLKDLSSDAELPVVHVHTEDVRPAHCHQCKKNLLLSEPRQLYGIILAEDVDMPAGEMALSLQQSNAGQYVVDYVRKCKDTRDYTYSNLNEVEDKVRVYRIGAHLFRKFLTIWALPERDFEFDRYNTRPIPRKGVSMLQSNSFKNMWKMGVMAAISSVYGGIHASLWNHHFPTTAERWIWRISSVIVAGNGVFITGLLSIVWVSDSEADEMEKIFWGHDVFKLPRKILRAIISAFHYNTPTLFDLFAVALIVFSILFQLIFLFCRIFLFVDAFLSLRSQPPSAYQTPQWTQWLPHL